MTELVCSAYFEETFLTGHFKILPYISSGILVLQETKSQYVM